jgi:hypothetical protein
MEIDHEWAPGLRPQIRETSPNRELVTAIGTAQLSLSHPAIDRVRGKQDEAEVAAAPGTGEDVGQEDVQACSI